jgi:hypothetical protein
MAQDRQEQNQDGLREKMIAVNRAIAFGSTSYSAGTAS